MNRNVRRFRNVMWAVAPVVALCAMLAAVWNGRGSDDLPQLYDAPVFSLMDQNGHTVSDAALRGNVWVAMVFFTQCPDVCPMMSARMAQLQKAVTQPDVKIVSFSLDPAHDTPQTMKDYAGRLGADQTRWHMLTGPEATMYSIARELKLAATPATGTQPITHTQKVLLIDRQNHVRGVYDSSDAESMKKLAEDARNLAVQ